jgi:hypothetical protein
MLENGDGLSNGSGPYKEHWRSRLSYADYGRPNGTGYGDGMIGGYGDRAMTGYGAGNSAECFGNGIGQGQSGGQVIFTSDLGVHCISFT